jgi:hypothetical protein
MAAIAHKNNNPLFYFYKRLSKQKKLLHSMYNYTSDMSIELVGNLASDGFIIYVKSIDENNFIEKFNAIINTSEHTPTLNFEGERNGLFNTYVLNTMILKRNRA